jgi:hypothetical protein
LVTICHVTEDSNGAEEVSLPLRPQLLPGLQLLERGADEIQIGLDSRHAVVASDLPPQRDQRSSRT